MPLPKSTEAGFPATFSTASRLSGEEGRKFVKITESTNNTSQLNSLSKRQNLPSGSSNQSKFAALLEAFGKKNQPKATTEVKDMTSPLTLDDYRDMALPVRQRRLLRSKYVVARSEKPSKELPDAPQQIQKAIQEAARRFKLPVKLVTAVVKVESNFNPRAVSSAGARGLMQLMPATAAELGVRNSFDISQNIHGGCSYLKDLLEQFGGNLPLALAAYNAGPGAVEKYGRIPPYKETQDYVKKVLAYC